MKPEIQTAFKQHKANILAQLDTIEKYIKANANYDIKTIHWGHVGDLGYMESNSKTWWTASTAPANMLSKDFEMDACHITLAEIAHHRHLKHKPNPGETYTLLTGTDVRIVRPLNAERTNFLAEILPLEEEELAYPLYFKGFHYVHA